MKRTARHAVAFMLATVAAFSTAPDAAARRNAAAAVDDGRSFALPAAGTIEVAFSPDEGSQTLVVKVIDSARSQIRMLAYSFTSAPVTSALLRARHRGVDVRLVVDERENTSQDRSGKARAALSALANAGAEVRLVDAYAIHHDKVIIADQETVELGSFNFSDAAAHRNSENVMVNWKNAALARVYLEHFQRNYVLGVPFGTRY